MQVKTAIDFTEKSAIFSDDQIYRYQLLRRWEGGNGKFVTFVMLNPSTADHLLEDPTIRRCCLYAKDWGYSGIIILNIFAYRDTDPKNMKAYHAPVGPDNDWHILEVSRREDVGLVIAAWGSHGIHLGRSEEVRKLLSNIDLHCLQLTNSGQPGHPLYLKKNLLPTLYI